MATRTQILVRGIVQGVGFRPYVYTLAQRRALTGRVFNNPTGVVIEVQGEPCAIEEFVCDIRLHPPPLSHIEAVERNDNLTPADFRDFRIVASAPEGAKFTPISADSATCPDCRRELFDPRDRRYRYPFINCTNCGPRFTIIEGIPYDRAQTTMRDFEMCPACRAEYENPLDRRFHAEPIACPDCGPQLFLTDAHGHERANAEEAVSRTRQLLAEGEIVAIKGLGGFHLACAARNAAAVARLRQRKYREEKPFALMAASVAVVRQFCLVSAAEEQLLSSERRPIVLLERRPEAALPTAIAPGVRALGFMLPYTPLHHLLLEGLEHPLVMTSGNVSDEPISYEDADAMQCLCEIADYFLRHNRRIFMRTDDSVARVVAGQEMILRRARGYAPAPLKTAFKFKQQILACGAELKNTFCLARDQHAFISHHIGDLENAETLRSFTEGIEHFKRLFDLRPTVVAYDLHPEYLSTKYAQALADDVRKIGVQHHHAHIASCLADNQVAGEVIGVAMDGLGFGSDGKLWGGEFFVADFAQAERLAHLAYIPMPGGAQAIREPWRMAAVYLQRALGATFLNLDLPFVRQLDRRAWTTLQRMIATGVNSPETSSMGRLFDALASLLGLRNTVTYEGQAAIELETLADRGVTQGYEFELMDDGTIKAEAVIQHAVDDLLNGRPSSEVSAKFHLAVAHLIVEVARQTRAQRRFNRIALSGGVFQNMFLLERVCQMLVADGFEVFTHHRVPANDGGISLGQAAIANAQFGTVPRA
ncbi:MAG: carbamoyltransferase HypF [Acidobacteria bacterium]|nr:carbamoyltransferase HypF [Acidobacteriota bacterium]MBI3423953.1 carbamoyltransferase HypF [Acidobacteriota bacterium]